VVLLSRSLWLRVRGDDPPRCDGPRYHPACHRHYLARWPLVGRLWRAGPVRFYWGPEEDLFFRRLPGDGRIDALLVQG